MRPIARRLPFGPAARLLVALSPALLAPAAAPARQEPAREEPPQKSILLVPGELGAAGLEARKDAQFDTLDRFKAFYFFNFRDGLEASGIRFRHRIVDDAGRDYKMVHYDHGNGVVAADVDGDERVDLYFTTQVGTNQLWRNLGGGRFEDVTGRAGVGVEDRISVSAAFGDIDNDGDPDLFVTTVKMGNLLFENDGTGRFREISKAAGVDYVGHSSGALFFDYDRDGRLDLFVTNVGTYTIERQGREGYWVGVEGAFSGHLFPERTERSILYRNLGGNRFADVSEETGLVDPGWSGDAAAVDLDRDGFQDLYVLNMQGDDHFWRNVEGKRFEQRRAAHFPLTPWGAMGLKFFDYDNDGRLDLLLTDMHSDMSESIGVEREKLKSRMQWSDEHLQGGADNVFGNAFYRNLGEGRFEEISDAVGAENYWPWGLSTGDLNADGYLDVFITASMNYPFRYGVNSLLLNNLGESFLDSEFVLGAEPRPGGRVATDWFELDCSGADREHEHCEGVDGPAVVRGALGSRSSVIFDLDGDGDLDIVTNDFNSEPLVLLSDLSEQLEVRWLEIELEGRRSNRDGLGAIVTVTAGDLVQTRAMDGASGYLSHSLLPLYVGLGDAARVDRIDVEWPSGLRQTVTEGLEPGRRIRIVEELPAAE